MEVSRMIATLQSKGRAFRRRKGLKQLNMCNRMKSRITFWDCLRFEWDWGVWRELGWVSAALHWAVRSVEGMCTTQLPCV